MKIEINSEKNKILSLIVFFTSPFGWGYFLGSLLKFLSELGVKEGEE